MSQTVQIEAAARKGVGKGAARASRRAGNVPAVIYGGKQAPVAIEIPQNVLLKILRSGGFYTTTFDIMVDGEAHRVLPKDMQKNKLNGLPIHVDFLRMVKGSKVVVNVPVHFANEDNCPGLRRGGVLNVVRHEVELSVDADAIPDQIVIDLASFEAGDAIKISAAPLPEGAAPTITDRDFTIATIAAPAGMPSDEPDEAPAETEVIEQKGDEEKPEG